MTPFEAIRGVANACQPLTTIVTGGQPAPEHITALQAAGVSLVLDLRDPMEPRPFDEPAAVRAAGLEYVNVPVSAATMTDETLDRILAVLREAGERSVFFHCASASRVGGTMIPYFMLDLGMEEDDAVQQAMRIGLRSQDLVDWALDYVRRRAAA